MRIFVKVKVRARELRVECIDDQHFIVAVNALPIDGRANKAVIRALADYFDVSVSALTLVSGQSSKQKVFELRK